VEQLGLDGYGVMKTLLAVVIALLTILLVLQVRSNLVRPKWEYKTGLLDGDLCEPEFLAASKTDAHEDRLKQAAEVLTACLSRMGNDGWELVSMEDTASNLFPGVDNIVVRHHTQGLFKRQKPN
jgi:hypothetical protein